MTCKCAKRLAKLERDVTRLRAQLPKEIHHAVRTELRVERKMDAEAAVHAAFHHLGPDSYSEREG